VLPGHQCAIVRDTSEVYAVDLTCTHLGCTVTAARDGFVCPCHGSRFGADGQVARGPATACLKRLDAEHRDGTIQVFRG
jgi:Rieske Fe-S protein